MPAQTKSKDGLYFGAACPASGSFQATGPETECTTGIGSYTVDLICPKFTVRTYISY